MPRSALWGRVGDWSGVILCPSPLPLWERVDRMSAAHSRRVRGLSPRIETPHPPSLREGTFSHKGRREERKRGGLPTAPSSTLLLYQCPPAAAPAPRNQT